MMNGSNSVSMVILNLGATAAKDSMFTRYLSFKKIEILNFKGYGVVIVLVFTICVCPEFLSYITGLGVLDKTVF